MPWRPVVHCEISVGDNLVQTSIQRPWQITWWPGSRWIGGNGLCSSRSISTHPMKHPTLALWYIANHIPSTGGLCGLNVVRKRDCSDENFQFRTLVKPNDAITVNNLVSMGSGYYAPWLEDWALCSWVRDKWIDIPTKTGPTWALTTVCIQHSDLCEKY